MNKNHFELMEQAINLINSEDLPTNAMELFDEIYGQAEEITQSFLDDLRTSLIHEMIDKGLLDNEGPVEPDTKAAKIEAAVAQSATSPENDLPAPTDAQKEMGNYKKGKFPYCGLTIVIENAKDSVRSGKSPDGSEWTSPMTAHYGYVAKTEGADGDQVDVFVGQDITAEFAYVIDQVDSKTKLFDEHKVMLCCGGEEEARMTYLSNYEDGWQGLGAITEMSIEAFKEWLKGDTTKPVSLLVAVKPEALPE